MPTASPWSSIWSKWPGVLAGSLALALFARTLAPGLTWAHDGADGGDLLSAALTRGVPHPPGYPAYELLLRAWIGLYRGDPARAGNWFSALCAALAVALVADLARRALPASRWRGVLATASALAWATSPALWSQAVITEVYTLNALIVVVLLWLLWHWRDALQTGHSGQEWLLAAGFAFGLGLGNHLSLALMVPGAVAWWWTSRLPARGPGDLRKLVGRWPGFAMSCLLGLAVYAYLPWAAAGNPPINWGDPRTPLRLWWLVSGHIYQGLVFGLQIDWLPQRLAAWAAEALAQFGPWGALIAIVGLWRVDNRDRALWRLSILTVLAYSAYAIGYNTADSYIYLLPIWAVGTLWLAAGLDYGVQKASIYFNRALRRLDHPSPLPGSGQAPPPALGVRVVRYAASGVLALLLAALPFVSATRHWNQMDLSHDHSATDFVERVLSTTDPDAVVLTESDGPTFALWYAIYGLGRRTDLTPINVSLYDYPWYRQVLASHHPQLNVPTGTPPSLEQFLIAVAAHQPLYRAENLDLTLAAFEERSSGPLVRMLPR